jgi:hypothetical protein
MGKKETAKWNHFGDMLSSGRSVHQMWFGRKLLGKWINAGLVRTVRHWEDSVEVSGGIVREWNVGEIIATEKGLELL